MDINKINQISDLMHENFLKSLYFIQVKNQIKKGNIITNSSITKQLDKSIYAISINLKTIDKYKVYAGYSISRSDNEILFNELVNLHDNDRNQYLTVIETIMHILDKKLNGGY